MFAVLFEVCPRPDAWDAYLGHAASLRPELLNMDGFLSNERYRSRSRPGWLLSLSLWRDEKALIRWRTHALHHDIQGKGRSRVFSDYHLRVGELTSGQGAGPPQRLDVTEAGTGTAATITDAAAALAPVPAHADLLDWDVFNSLTREGAAILLLSWCDVPAAEEAARTRPDTRSIRIIRDYGMRRRHEAPQYFPPV